MSSDLSFSAIRRIIFLVENDDRPADRTKKGRTAKPTWPLSIRFTLQQVSNKWWTVYELYRGIKPAPPLDYLHSLELALVHKGKVDDEDVRAIFAHPKPLEFWGCPRQLVSKIVDVFGELQNKPEYLDVTITALNYLGAMMPSEAWSQVYRTHLPCNACTTVQTIERRSVPHPRLVRSFGGTVDVTVKKFHIASESFGKRLTVELHELLADKEEGMSESGQVKSSRIHKIRIRVGNETCAAKDSLPAVADRSRPTKILLADLASGVYGFLDRAHIGSSLLANGDLHDLIVRQLKKVLPVHRLTCCFDETFSIGRQGWYDGTRWLVIRHSRRDSSYADLRRFELPSTASAESDCTLIRHYLSNSHVDDLLARADFFRYAMKMLASLADRDFSIGRLELTPLEKRLSDYRSMDAIFGKMHLNALTLLMTEHRFVELVKITDFFRMSTIQGLRRLKLTLIVPCTRAEKPRSEVVSKNPLWLSGIYLLRDCEHYRICYEVDNDILGAPRLRFIARSVVRICEEFERGEITNTVDHFLLTTCSSQGMNYAFNRDNLLVSGMKVEGSTRGARVNTSEWDVYRFHNASTGEHLTACVGRVTDSYRSFLHIVKGEVYPDASYAQ